MEEQLAEESSVAEENQHVDRERRQNRRLEVDFPIRLYSPVRGEGRVLELSAGGMRVEVTDDLSHVMHISLEFDLPGLDEAIGCLADVRWHKQMGPKSEPRWVCGLRFSDLDERYRAAIAEFVAENTDGETETETEA